jgi:hypothetical protein
MTDPYQRRYTVRGIDEDGDVQAFHTDDLGAAESVLEQMQEDLRDVEMIDVLPGVANDDG